LAIVAIIPARYASERLPGKPLSDIQGKTMIERVHERVRRSALVERVIVATDDERIAAAVRGFGGEAVMTSPAHQSGTDRLAEAAAGLPDAEVVANVQGDEPLLDVAALDAAVGALLEDETLPMATVSVPLQDAAEMLNPSVVKVVTDAAGNASYFSRSPIPFVRQGARDLAESAAAAVRLGLARKHVGLYVYRRGALLRFASLPPAPLERAEGLEQLRALHHGLRLKVVPCAGMAGPAVDTPEDLARVREILAGDILGQRHLAGAGARSEAPDRSGEAGK
jgi:3-deoxy-manno-octulosonate cytidylyltransferase (CMP-KDO synthetase)